MLSLISIRYSFLEIQNSRFVIMPKLDLQDRYRSPLPSHILKNVVFWLELGSIVPKETGLSFITCHRSSKRHVTEELAKLKRVLKTKWNLVQPSSSAYSSQFAHPKQQVRIINIPNWFFGKLNGGDDGPWLVLIMQDNEIRTQGTASATKSTDTRSNWIVLRSFQSI